MSKSRWMRTHLLAFQITFLQSLHHFFRIATKESDVPETQRSKNLSEFLQNRRTTTIHARVCVQFN